MIATIQNISGLDDAICAMLLSRRKWSHQKDEALRDACDKCMTRRGFWLAETPPEAAKTVLAYLPGLVARGIKEGHHTLIQMIDISVTIQDMHRGAQDDLDAHAHRMGNRVIRNSTRLGKWKGGERSDWYRGKILTAQEAGTVEDEVSWYGEDFKWNGFGYVRKDLFDDQDVQRGTYPLSIPSTFTFRVSYDGLRHIYSLRGPKSHANPEIHEALDMLHRDLLRKMPWMGDFLPLVWDKWSKVWRNSITGAQLDYDPEDTLKAR
jgi:hypothetical protein